MEIRTAGPADINGLLSLIEKFYAIDGHDFSRKHLIPPLTTLLGCDQRGVVGIAISDGAPVGYAIVTWGYSLEAGGVEALLDEIYVEDRGHGLGQLLMTWAEQISADHAATRITLETEVANDRARAFYQRLGYEIDDSVWLGKWLGVTRPAT